MTLYVQKLISDSLLSNEKFQNPVITKKFNIKTQQTLLSSLLDVFLQTDRSKIKNIANVTVKDLKYSMVPPEKMKLL